MNRNNRKSGLSLTPTLFKALHRAILNLFKEKYQIAPDTIVDYQLYGFNYYDDSLPSIKKLILEVTGKWVNGKYLYNKYREWKNGGNPIQFTREFVFIYFQALGLKDINEFIQQSSLSEAAIQDQLNLGKPTTATDLKVEYYVGYYEGEDGDIIYCRLTLSEQTAQAQIVLIYWEEEKEYSEYVYTGKIIYQQNGMSLFFKNEDTILDRSQFIGIYCERQMKVKPFLVGTISGYDRDRRPVVGEAIFQRVNSKEELKNITQNKKVDAVIAQYLSGRRWAVNNKMIQNLNDLLPESKHAPIIEKFTGSYRGVFVAIESGVYMLELKIKDNTGNATFNIGGHPRYQGIIKVQASGQLLIGKLINVITKAPLFMSIEVLPIKDKLYKGDLMGVSRFDKSISGKIYLSIRPDINKQLPEYRSSELTAEEIQDLPKDILSDIMQIFKKNRLEKHFRERDTSIKSQFMNHLEGSYKVVLKDSKQDNSTALLSIEGNGQAYLKHQHFTYEGSAMMCEGAVLSIYFIRCNGISHCGQIMAKIGRENPKVSSEIRASWHFINDHFMPEVKDITIIAKASK